MKTMILAGGAGKRLRPLTCTLPKPMLPMLNKPLLYYTLRLLRDHGITDPCVTLGYMPREIRHYFGTGENLGMELEYFQEEKPKGTAGGVLAAGADKDTTLVISGDALTDLDLGAVLDFHKKSGGVVTIVLKKVECPLEYGVAVTDKTGRISRFVEKPTWSLACSDTVNTGIYIVEPQAWEGVQRGETLDFSKDVFPRLLERGDKIFGFVTEDYWCDVGSPEQYMQAHRDVLDGKCKLPMDASLVDGYWVEDGARLAPGSVVQEKCYIGANAYIGRDAVVESYSVIGSGACVGDNASIKRSVLWSGADIGENAHIRGAIIGKNAMIGADTCVYEHAVLSDDVWVGDEAVIDKGARVWPEKSVEERCQLSGDVCWTQSSRKLFFGNAAKELSGERACRIGRALATVAGEGQRLTLATDGSKEAYMAKCAVKSGVLECGCDVIDFGKTVLPAFRFGTSTFRTAGGAYLSRKGLQVVDGGGMDAGPVSMQELQMACDEGGMVKKGERIGISVLNTDVAPYYRAEILSRVDQDAMKRENGCAVIVTTPLAADMLSLLFALCGWRTIEAANGREAAKLAGRIDGIAMSVTDDGLELYQGDRVIKGAELMLFLAVFDLVLGEKELYCTTGIYNALLQVTKKYDAKVYCLPQRDLVRTMAEKTNLSAEALRDPYATALLLCSRLSEKGLTLDDIFEHTPKLTVARKLAPVKRNKIGRIFSTIAEENPGADLTEGVRVQKNGGWVSIVPDEAARNMSITAMAMKEEYAESIAELFRRRVEDLNGQ